MNDTDETREALTAGYVEDLEPIDLIDPYLPTHAESRYVRLEQQEHTR